MAKLKVRFIIVLFLMGVTAVIITRLQHDATQDTAEGFEILEKIPKQIGQWRGEDLHLEELVYKILETRAIIHRNYTNTNGDTILLSIVHYYDTKVNFHAPESCLGGRGEKVQKQQTMVEINRGASSVDLDVAKLISTTANKSTVSYYFYRTGGFLGRSYFKMRFQLAKNVFKGLGKSGSLVRVTGVTSTSEGMANVETLLESFMQDLVPIITI